jgi:hypothetical protein
MVKQGPVRAVLSLGGTFFFSVPTTAAEGVTPMRATLGALDLGDRKSRAGGFLPPGIKDAVRAF